MRPFHSRHVDPVSASRPSRQAPPTLRGGRQSAERIEEAPITRGSWAQLWLGPTGAEGASRRLVGSRPERLAPTPGGPSPNPRAADRVSICFNPLKGLAASWTLAGLSLVCPLSPPWPDPRGIRTLHSRQLALSRQAPHRPRPSHGSWRQKDDGRWQLPFPKAMRHPRWGRSAIAGACIRCR